MHCAGWRAEHSKFSAENYVRILKIDSYFFLCPTPPHLFTLKDLQNRCGGVYNGQMFRDDKNLKDLGSPLPNLPLIKGEEQGGGLSYTKTNKLITALYMVTDIIDKDEPLRNKLRTLGTGIISDMSSVPVNACNKINEIMSFLDIASAINIISQMNCNILRKEFLELDQSIKELKDKKMNLLGLFNSPKEELYPYLKLGSQSQACPLQRGRSKEGVMSLSRGELNPKGHTRLGVQKGSTLLKALSVMSDRNVKIVSPNSFDILKKQRRDEVNNFIAKNGGQATITDIKNGAQGSLISCSEKTLQRELASMVKDGVLNKTGEKRWSKYFVNAIS
jgi:hypothetical protein